MCIRDRIENLDSLLRQFGDLERLINKAAMDRLTPREAVQLKRALAVLNPFKNSLDDSQNEEIKRIGSVSYTHLKE